MDPISPDPGEPFLSFHCSRGPAGQCHAQARGWPEWWDRGTRSFQVMLHADCALVGPGAELQPAALPGLWQVLLLPDCVQGGAWPQLWDVQSSAPTRLHPGVCSAHGALIFFFFFKILFIYSWHTQREREREAEIQAEGEAGPMQGA